MPASGVIHATPKPPLDHGVTGDTVEAVRTISIKQLHARTGHWVRPARQQTLIVTNRGEKIATLQVLGDQPSGIKFEKRDWSKFSVSDLHSTDLISADRDGRRSTSTRPTSK